MIGTDRSSDGAAAIVSEEPGSVFAMVDLVVLRARLERVRDLDPPMSILCLNEIIYQVGRQANLIAYQASLNVANKPLSPSDAVAFLTEAARYFRNRPDGGEDMAFWANVGNAEACEKIIAMLEPTAAPQVGTPSAATKTE